MKIMIRFRSGFVLPITCEECKFSRHAITGELDSYSFKGITDNKLIFFRSEDVECIWRDLSDEVKNAED